MAEKQLKRWLACAFLALLIALVVNFAATRTQAVAAPENGGQAKAMNAHDLSSLSLLLMQGGSAQASAQGEKTVEQVRKNIQVLKGLPDSQLIPVMNLMSTSLGVQCTYCHVRVQDPQTGRNDFAFEKDDKEEKQTARKMIQMVVSLNSANRNILGGGISCYTCHAGRAHPINVPALPIAPPQQRREGGPGTGGPGGGVPGAGGSGGAPNAGGPSGAPAGGPGQGGGANRQAGPGGQSGPGGQTAAARPTAEQILSKYIQAVGGQAAADKVKSLALIGTVEGPPGRNAPVEIIVAVPDKMFMTQTTQQGTMSRALNGTTGWAKTGDNVRDLNPGEITQGQRIMRTLDIIKVSATPTQGMRFGGVAKVGDRDANILRAQLPDGSIERLFFDAETGLLLRRIVITNTMIGPLPEQVDYEDYRDVNGVKIPFTVRISTVTPTANTVAKFTDIKTSATVDETKFKKP